MKLNLHPQATENYNAKIEELITKLTSEDPSIEKMNEPNVPNPDIHTSFHFDKTNIIGELKLGWTDFSGRVSARAFDNGEKVVGLFDNDYKNLIRIAEGLQKSITPKEVVSVELLEGLLFDWIKFKSRNVTELSATDFVLSECEKQINEYEIWIPISQLFIQSPFVLGKITFKAITKIMVDEWETHTLLKAKETNIDTIKIYFQRIRRDIQGLATATIKVEAEPKRAYEIAFEETEKAMSALRFFSPVNFSPAKIGYCAPWGKQHQDSNRYLIIQENKIIQHFSGFSDKSNTHWNLSNEALRDYWSTGLQVFDFLLKQDKLTDFQEKYLEAVSIYSRSSLNKQISDRLLYTLTALETIFLKNTGEYIQDAISFRMAFMHPVSVEERREIISNIKETYAIRSSFVHHGQSPSIDNLKILEKFMVNAWMSLQALTVYVVTDTTKEQFFEQLENRRLAG